MALHIDTSAEQFEDSITSPDDIERAPKTNPLSSTDHALSDEMMGIADGLKTLTIKDTPECMQQEEAALLDDNWNPSLMSIRKNKSTKDPTKTISQALADAKQPPPGQNTKRGATTRTVERPRTDIDDLGEPWYSAFKDLSRIFQSSPRWYAFCEDYCHKVAMKLNASTDWCSDFHMNENVEDFCSMALPLLTSTGILCDQLTISQRESSERTDILEQKVTNLQREVKGFSNTLSTFAANISTLTSTIAGYHAENKAQAIMVTRPKSATRVIHTAMGETPIGPHAANIQIEQEAHELRNQYGIKPKGLGAAKFKVKKMILGLNLHPKDKERILKELREAENEDDIIKIASSLRGGTSHHGRTEKSDERSHEQEDVKLPCGHEVLLNYLIAWCQYCLKQKKSEFTCPRFDMDLKQTCGAEFSYQMLCRSASLPAKTKESFEKTLGELTASKLCEYKQCPGCNSYVERADKKNLCVRCTICTVEKKSTYEFCWICRRPWKGPAISAVTCDNIDCGKQGVNQPNPLQLCSPRFKREKETKEKDDIYPMMDKKSPRNRLALLINNINFAYASDRVGAEKDELSMEKLLESLGYTVVTLRNLSAEGMDNAMQDFSQREEHKESDSCFVVFMSHGEASGISGIFHLDDKEQDLFHSDRIFHHLNTINCAGLRDKPKIILIQSCRGGLDGDVCVEDSVCAKSEHREKDFCCLRSCTPDTVSYRSEKTGTVFIQTIVKIFNQYACQDHIEELFRKVLKTFKEKHPNQMPCKERTSVSKRIYLFPGL